MPIPDGLTRVVYSGGLCTNTERWAFSLWFKRDDGTIALDFSAGEPTAATYTAWRAAFLALMRPEDSFTQLDSYLYAGGAAVQHTQATFNRPGTGTLAVQPAQIACVMTLRTALANRSGRGRIYVPARAMQLSTTTGLAIATAPNNCADALAAYLTDLHTLSAQTHPVVASPTTSSSHTITSVDVDLVPDTQRRRRNKLVSTRHSATVTG